jgi:hypothetical protein
VLRVVVEFSTADVPEHVADAVAFMEQHGKTIRDRLIELGNEIIADLAGEAPDEEA